MKTTWTILLTIICFALAAQSVGVQVSFVPVYHKQPLVLERLLFHNNDSFSISTLRFYISGVRLYKADRVVWTEASSYHLVDLEDPSSLQFDLPISATTAFDHIRFNLGIDSVTNTGGAGSGALDATKGMYWAWQSGYINFKLEGTHSACPTRKHELQFHLGGFRGKDYCMQQITLPVKKSNEINIQTDVAALLDKVDLATQNTIMSPGTEAVQLSRKAVKMFSIRTGK